jgi:glycine cleavage system aminomethyltransferase T
MVEFGGFSMPVTYSDMTISESALWTREHASLFDVSHMYVNIHISLVRTTPTQAYLLMTCTGYSMN